MVLPVASPTSERISDFESLRGKTLIDLVRMNNLEEANKVIKRRNKIQGKRKFQRYHTTEKGHLSNERPASARIVTCPVQYSVILKRYLSSY